MFQAPLRVKMLAKQHRKTEGAAVYIIKDTAYIIVARGQKCTEGYGVRVSSVMEGTKEYNIDVHVEYKNPEPGQVLAQVITYPLAIIEYVPEKLSENTRFNFLIDGTYRVVCTAQTLK